MPVEPWAALVKQLPENSIVLGITSIVWRNAWKYGDPGFRYTHHDVGHQISSFAFAAAAQNASVVLLDSLTDDEISRMMREVDEDGSGQIDFDEFLGMMRNKMMNEVSKIRNYRWLFTVGVELGG